MDGNTEGLQQSSNNWLHSYTLDHEGQIRLY